MAKRKRRASIWVVTCRDGGAHCETNVLSYIEAIAFALQTSARRTAAFINGEGQDCGPHTVEEWRPANG